MSHSQYHGLMSVLNLIAYYLSGRIVLIGIVSGLFALLYILDICIGIDAVRRIKTEDDKD